MKPTSLGLFMLCICTSMLAYSCALRPNLEIYSIDYENRWLEYQRDSSGLIAFEQFEDGPMQFSIPLIRKRDSITVVLVAGSRGPLLTPNQSERSNLGFVSKYIKANRRIHRPLVFEVDSGWYYITELRYYDPLRERGLNNIHSISVQKDSIWVAPGKIQYIGSYAFFGEDKPFSTTHDIEIECMDNFSIIKSLLHSKNSIFKDIETNHAFLRINKSMSSKERD